MIRAQLSNCSSPFFCTYILYSSAGWERNNSNHILPYGCRSSKQKETGQRNYQRRHPVTEFLLGDQSNYLCWRSTRLLDWGQLTLVKSNRFQCCCCTKSILYIVRDLYWKTIGIWNFAISIGKLQWKGQVMLLVHSKKSVNLVIRTSLCVNVVCD